MGIFYFILVWTGLKFLKLKKMGFFLPITNVFAKQNNPLMELCLIKNKTLNKNELKVFKFQIHRFSSFSAFKKIVTEVERGGGKFILF